MTGHHEEDTKGSIVQSPVDAPSQLKDLWKRSDTEVVVSVVPSQIRGNSFIIHHSELRTLRPHQWLTGEVIECLLHHFSNELHLERMIYILNHYTAGVILFGNREQIRRNTLSKINFDNYKAIVSFVNIHNSHWKLLYINAAEKNVYLVDPARRSTELTDSDHAAKRICEYFKLRRTCHSKTDWVDIKFKGGVLQHPLQQHGDSCGVLVIMMANAVMEAFPKIPNIAFGTTKTEMEHQRTLCKYLKPQCLT
ncbi:uncharacterized protein LOC133973671 [Platichthys flesus]|uniref:uncharacterized protein LOC133973671 n=1 Tax=Platichthys flesus TaxID=8260 RepID=UPI002DB7AAAF|nr:uncharacterized protein LOC133973671 [Platichthys flesus]